MTMDLLAPLPHLEERGLPDLDSKSVEAAVHLLQVPRVLHLVGQQVADLKHSLVKESKSVDLELHQLNKYQQQILKIAIVHINK